jgi:hypothetical protein
MLAMLTLFLVGVILACLGLMSLYVGHIHSEVKGRPLYVVRTDAKGRLGVRAYARRRPVEQSASDTVDEHHGQHDAHQNVQNVQNVQNGLWEGEPA